MLKIRWSELLQRATQLWIETMGYEAAQFRALNCPDPLADIAAYGPMSAYLHSRVTTIYGGSNEIQRNIIARRALDL